MMGEFGVGHIGWTIGVGHTAESCREQEALLTRMMKASGRPLHVVLGDDEGFSWVESARAEGLPVLNQLSPVGSGAQFKLDEYNLFDYMPSWVDPLVGSPEERMAKLRDPSIRPAMKRDVDQYPNPRTQWDKAMVLEVVHDRNYHYEGKSIKEIAEMTGKHPVDTFLDLALDEELLTEFSHPVSPQDEESREQRLKNPYVHISVSDGGAHTRYMMNSVWPIYFLSHWVRDNEVVSLEQAHYKMSALPAWFADFKDRGTLRVGDWADVIVYNLEELGQLYEKSIFDTDFPGGERRLIQKPTGLRYTIVNGTVTFEGNDCTQALPGKLLRSDDMVG